ncbi:hypothetical protein ZOSMA_82G00730 [Zostera marina]|uniref:Cyclin-dependent kinase inhibitor domain-containing protein n=1 Tax=Zostera marina TaxID=29655 RepID=A0A0K9NNV5_ZOSMR|nr:hypothetical protein ZOSMA_82G00730 [Zostera marina]
MAGDGSKKLRSRTLVIKPLTKRRRARVRKTADSVPTLVNSGFADVTTGISSHCFSNFSVEVGRFGEEEERQWSRSDRFKLSQEEGEEEIVEDLESTSCINLLINDEENRKIITTTTSRESCNMESTRSGKSSRRRSASARITKFSSRMPSELEINSFFAMMETDDNKRFMDKYNYDVLNDLPMEGRYEWVGIGNLERR